LDFSQADAREAMQAVLADVKGQFGKNYPPVIGNQPVEVAGWIESVNPSHTTEVVGRAGKATPSHAQEAVAAAWGACPRWRDTEASECADYLFQAAAVMRRRRFELAAWEVYECGKPCREADADVAEAIDFCEYYARQMLEL